MESKNISDNSAGGANSAGIKRRTSATEKLSLCENFQRYFSVVYAKTQEQKESVYSIRYRVYCEEFGYEPADRFPNKMEFDGFDEHAQHCLIMHRRSGLPAGCVRLVPALGKREEMPLPFEKFCIESLDMTYIRSLNLDRGSVCEISRLAVDSAFRRRSGESLTRFGEVDAMDCSQQEQRTFSLIAVAGFLASTALTDLTGKTNVFAMMEPFLPRLMKRSGIVFQRAGKDINYHGIRAPYFIRTQDAIDNMRPDLRTLYQWIREKIGATYVE